MKDSVDKKVKKCEVGKITLYNMQGINYEKIDDNDVQSQHCNYCANYRTFVDYTYQVQNDVI